jgi:hypothetical protein
VCFGLLFVSSPRPRFACSFESLAVVCIRIQEWPNGVLACFRGSCRFSFYFQGTQIADFSHFEILTSPPFFKTKCKFCPKFSPEVEFFRLPYCLLLLVTVFPPPSPKKVALLWRDATILRGIAGNLLLLLLAAFFVWALNPQPLINCRVVL